MSTINRLSSVDALQPGDLIPVWDSSNGDTRKASMSTLLAFVESYFADPDYSTRIVAPAVDYFTVDIGATGDSIWMIINPTLNFTNGAVTLPPASSAVNDQEITVVFTASVSTFVITSAGATVIGTPVQINGYDSFRVRYNAAQQTWYNIGTTGSGSGGGVSQIVRQDFTGDGTTTTFALLNIPSALGNELQIFIDGVYQERAGYTVSGVNIIFSEAPPALSNIEVLGWSVSIGAETSANLVSYTPAGTGAVLTTVQAKLRESVSVKDFGAVGDGVTDTYAQIALAVAAIGADDKTLEFPVGDYYVGTSITFPSNITVAFTSNSHLVIPSGTAVVFNGAVMSYGGHPFKPVTAINYGTVTIGTNIESRSLYAGAIDVEAQTYAQLTTGTQPYYTGAYGPTPNDAGVQFVALNSEGTRKVFGAIQVQITSTAPGSETSRMHFLVNDTDFSQIIGTIDQDGSWILGPGSGAYAAEICGVQEFSGVPAPGAVFGERVSAADPDYEDCRVLAVRNTKTAATTSYRVGMGFSILNAAGKERPTGHVRFQYSDLTDGSEYSYYYPTTLVAGVQTNGPYFYNNGIGFDPALGESKKLDAYSEASYESAITFGGAAVGMTASGLGSYTQIGNRVYGSARIYVTTKGSSTGAVKLTLPLTASLNDRNSAAVAIFVRTTVGAGEPIMGVIDVGANTITVSKNIAGSAVALTHADFADGSDLNISFQYYVD